MELNKDYLIYALIAVILLLLMYITFQEPAVKTLTQTEYETVFKEKIVYEYKECKKKTNDKKEEVSNISEIEEEEKQYVIASSSDASHRYSISLFSYADSSKVNGFKKTVLNGILKNDEFENFFIMDVNQVQLNELNDVYFKIKDNQTEKVYIATNTCLYNLLENFIYKVDLEISGDDITCNVSEDRELEENSENIIIPFKVKGNVKNTFLKMDSNGI